MVIPFDVSLKHGQLERKELFLVVGEHSFELWHGDPVWILRFFGIRFWRTGHATEKHKSDPWKAVIGLKRLLTHERPEHERGILWRR